MHNQSPPAVARLLALAYGLLSLGGFILHLRIHPPTESAFFLIPALSGALTTFVMPWLFLSRATVAVAYLINAGVVILGSVTMAYFAVTEWSLPVTLYNAIFNSTFPDIVVLCAKWPLAHGLLLLVRPDGPPRAERGCAS